MADRDGDAHGDAHGDARGEDAPAPGRWTSWLLVAACAAPPLLLAEAARRVLGGDRDGDYFGWYGASSFDVVDDPSPAEVPPGERFRVLWAVLDLPGPLWAAVAGGLLLTVVVLTGRPAALVPDRWGRRVAAAASWLSAAGSLAALLGLLAVWSAPEEDRRGRLPAIFGGGLPEDPPALAAAVAVLLPAVLVPALAGGVLWREAPPAPGPATAGPSGEPLAETPAGTPAGTPVEPTGEPTGGIPREAPREIPDEIPDEQVPVVAEADRHLYRRPG